LLDRIVAAGTPPIHRVTFRYGDDATVDIDLADPLYAPRRTRLDPIIADAASDAGADVRYGVTVEDLVIDASGRVRGVRARHRGGERFEAHATITVGADGMRSTLARQVGAPATHVGRVSSSFIYGYYAGVPLDGIEWLYAPGASAGLIPTDDGQVCAFVATGSPRFMRELRHDLHGAFDGLMAQVSPRAAGLLAAGRRVGRLRGAPAVPGWLRRPYGAGWALVGDAGYFKDPQSAHGITDALRDAELLARAVDDGLSGRAPMASALARYEAVRDDLSLPLFQAVEAVSAYDWTLEEVRTHHLAMSAAMRREVRHVADLDAIAIAAA
ncbi:MAG TPA: FAD-dependent monooxygenase, partial [Euzebya sp.]|nr:FAD-dependent monooxygenase [Euzebya sp.]